MLEQSVGSSDDDERVSLYWNRMTRRHGRLFSSLLDCWLRQRGPKQYIRVLFLIQKTQIHITISGLFSSPQIPNPYSIWTMTGITSISRIRYL